MRERDGRNHRDMCVLFRWACQDNFWSGNVLSPAKLRDKWTQLEINRNKQQAGVTASKPKLDLTNTDGFTGWIYEKTSPHRWLTLTVSRCVRIANNMPETVRRKAAGTTGSADHQRCVQPVTGNFPGEPG